jgi:plastocyanin
VGLRLHRVGGTFSVTFSEPGTFSYFCEIHPIQMQATVTVAG